MHTMSTNASVINGNYVVAAEIMICAFHLPGVKHGQDQLDIRLSTSGGLGL